MARELHGRLRQGTMLAEEDKEAVQPAAPGHNGPGCSPPLEGGRHPGINIRRRGLGQVLIERALPRLRYPHRETFQGAEGPFLCR